MEWQDPRQRRLKVQQQVQTYASAQGDNTDLYYSNLNREKVYTAAIQVIQASEKEGQELEYDEEVEYNFVVKNISNENVMNKLLSLEIMSYIDENLVPISAEYEYYEYNEETFLWEKAGTKTEDISQKYIEQGIDENSVADLYVVTAIPQGGEINLTIKCKASEVYEKTEVSNSLKIMYEYCGEHSVTSNIIKNIILPRDIEGPNVTPPEDIPGEDEKPGEDNGSGEGEKPEGGDIPGEGDSEVQNKYNISGFAWEDSNKNGSYDNDEKKTGQLFGNNKIENAKALERRHDNVIVAVIDYEVEIEKQLKEYQNKDLKFITCSQVIEALYFGK